MVSVFTVCRVTGQITGVDGGLGAVYPFQTMTDCMIIGAGISGLLAAKVMTDAGFSVQICEKGRGLGGRMATRRRDGAVFDHGAQFLTVRDHRFKKCVDAWQQAGIIETWYERDGSGKHFRAAPSMTAIAKHLARDLEVHRETFVQQVSRAGHWTIDTSDGRRLESRALITTAPIPQSLAILDQANVTVPETLRSIRFQRCIVAMAILDRQSLITANNGAIKLATEPIQWIGDNQRKGISPLPALTIHSTPAFAEQHWHSPNDEHIPILIESAQDHLGEARVLSADGHRWGFSQPTSAFSEEAYVDHAIRLAIAGDGLVGGRVEGAAISGLTAAAEILTTLAD